LKQNSAHDSQHSHERGLLPAKQRRYAVMILLVILDWLSIWGWNAELVQSLVPVSLNNSFHSVLVNTGSRSLTMDFDTPWSLTMVSKKALATVIAEYGWPMARMWAYLENRPPPSELPTCRRPWGSLRRNPTQCHTTRRLAPPMAAGGRPGGDGRSCYAGTLHNCK
jgi:hypothetical protein